MGTENSAAEDISFLPVLKMEPTFDEGIVFVEKNMFSSAFPIMDELRHQGKFCDILLKV